MERQERLSAAGLVGGVIGAWGRMDRVARAPQGRQAGRYHAHRYPPAPLNTIRMTHHQGRTTAGFVFRNSRFAIHKPIS